MPAFDRKEWLDKNVVPLLHQEPPLSLYSVFWNGHPPSDVMVLLLCEPDVWPACAARFLEQGFVFDYLRDVQLVPLEGRQVPLFGGDGAPLFDKSGSVSCRFFKKAEPSLIIQLGARTAPEGEKGNGLEAAALVRSFFAQYNDNPMNVCARFSAPFGQA